MKKSIRIAGPQGLEPRPIAELVQVASKYDSRIYLETGNKHVNAKSIMGMMSLQILQGDELTVSAEGSDETAAMQEIEQFLQSRILSGKA